MSGATAVSASKGGLSVTAYRGDAAVLLAFNLQQEPTTGFAGFAVKCTLPDGQSFFLKNRLPFFSIYAARIKMHLFAVCKCDYSE